MCEIIGSLIVGAVVGQGARKIYLETHAEKGRDFKRAAQRAYEFLIPSGGAHPHPLRSWRPLARTAIRVGLRAQRKITEFSNTVMDEGKQLVTEAKDELDRSKRGTDSTA
jgi:hypothetical protein